MQYYLHRIMKSANVRRKVELVKIKSPGRNLLKRFPRAFNIKVPDVSIKPVLTL